MGDSTSLLVWVVPNPTLPICLPQGLDMRPLPLSTTASEEDTKHRVDSVSPDVLTDNEHPQHLPIWRKWLAVIAISSSSLCVTCATSLVRLVQAHYLNIFGTE